MALLFLARRSANPRDDARFQARIAPAQHVPRPTQYVNGEPVELSFREKLEWAGIPLEPRDPSRPGAGKWYLDPVLRHHSVFLRDH